MSLIDRAGTFKGNITSSAIAASSGGYPQFVAGLEATEFFDSEDGWLDWSQYEEKEITGYFVLFGKDGKPFKNCGQLMKALGWSGRELNDLNTTDYSEIPVQFRVEENTYQGNTRLQVAWIDHVDATPGRSVEKMDAAGVKKLQAKYAAGLKALGGGPEISKPSTAPKPAPKPAATPAATGSKKGKNPPKKATATPPPSAPPAAPPTAEPTPEPDATSGEKCTKEEAWEGVCNGLPDTVTDEQIQSMWLETIAGLDGEENMDAEDWARCKGMCLDQLTE